MSATRAGTGEVNLRLVPKAPAVGIGEVVEFGLVAVSTTGANVSISGLTVVLTWDPTFLDLVGAANNPAYNWILSGFVDDSGADGLNDTHHDGDALFQAVGQFFLPAVVTPNGFLITTFRFTALQRTERTTVRMESRLGTYSQTEVLRFGAANEDVVGLLEPGNIALASSPKLWPLEMSVRAGRTADLIVFGEFVGSETFGVRVQAELTPMPEAKGTLTFTPAPPTDVFRAGDPWSGVGVFTPFDTNTAGGELRLNGSVADNGTFLAAPLTFVGPLTGMPVIAGVDALGAWTVSLNTSAGMSLWEPEGTASIATELRTSLIRVVAPHDGNGSGSVEVGDFAEFQACFTGSVGPVDPAAFDRDPRRRCAVYDDDEDGDVDHADYASFLTVHGNPVTP